MQMLNIVEAITSLYLNQLVSNLKEKLLKLGEHVDIMNSVRTSMSLRKCIMDAPEASI